MAIYVVLPNERKDNNISNYIPTKNITSTTFNNGYNECILYKNNDEDAYNDYRERCLAKFPIQIDNQLLYYIGTNSDFWSDCYVYTSVGDEGNSSGASPKYRVCYAIVENSVITFRIYENTFNI